MKKFEFALSESLYEQSSSMIRNKYSLLRLLAHAIKFLVSTPIPKDIPPDCSKLVLYIDKMSRLLFCTEGKIFTFQFPFQVQEAKDGSGYLLLRYKDFLEIDNMISSLLVAVFERDDIFDGTLENIDEKVLQEIVDNEWEGVDWESFRELIKQLVLFEPGYLRYDHDIENANGELHPEHHLDFFFSSNNAMKIGLQSEVQSEWMIDLLDTRTNCKYIK